MDDIEKTLKSSEKEKKINPKQKPKPNTKPNKKYKKQTQIPASALELKQKKFSKIKSKFNQLGIGRPYKGKIYTPHPPPQQQKVQNKTFTKEQTDTTEDDDGSPFWQQDEEIGNKWKNGYYYTINATLIYSIDIKKGQVILIFKFNLKNQISDIFMGWGAVLGSIISLEDAERLYCAVSESDLDKRPKKEDYEDWEEYQYKPIRKDPIQWFKENIFGNN